MNISRKQIKVTEWDKNSLKGTDSDGTTFHVSLPDIACYGELTDLLHQGCTLNILSYTNEDNTLHPKDIIYEPDYLIDISSLTRCVQQYGSPAIGYILNLFENSEESAARLLGEAANMFLDDCVNESEENPAEYDSSIEKFFREYPLQLSVCNGIDNEFFSQTRNQFRNIQQQIRNSFGNEQRNNMQLEPSFFCEALGLQGRIDLLQSDCRLLVELKSGKADDFRSTAKEEHRLQMSLYKEMLCYNLNIPRNCIQPHLFYSRYPRFYNEESTREAISKVLMLRNKIVALLQKMYIDGLQKELEQLTPEKMNENGIASRLWSNYQAPRIEKILAPIQNADEITKEYFFGNVAFVSREMMLAKAEPKGNDSGRCFADVWRNTLDEKLENGNILIDLQIEKFNDDEGITDISFKIPENSENFFPNFRTGDTVFIYHRNNEHDSAVNKQITRGNITEIGPDRVIFHLRHKQRNHSIFPIGSYYAMEHDHMDSTFRTTIRDLYSLLVAPKERLDLLLARRMPKFDKTRQLHGNYGNNYINDIVLKAKQADDLFMLIGPPGTGKTSQALSSMVREFYNEGECNLLLASYTNRAVDEICQTIERLPEKPAYIRIGSEQSSAPEHRNHLLKNVIAHCSNRHQIRNVINGTRIIIGTIAALGARKELFRLKKFNVAIIDEATQILESQLSGLMAAKSPDKECAIEKFILIGDPKQLPAVVVQTPEMSQVKSEKLKDIGITDYGTSLFERFHKRNREQAIEGLTATLYRQGRMHPSTCNFANSHFYGGILDSIPLPHQCEELQYATFDSTDVYQKILATRRTAFISTEKPVDNRKAKINICEARAIAQFVKAYHILRAANGYECDPGREIGIIVPFRNQIAMIANEIALMNIPSSSEIVIDTVERFQGSQREIILFGTTISRQSQLEIISSPTVDAEGMLIDRKLNVALTRARRQMFVFGNPEILAPSPLYRTLMQELNY